VCSSIECQRARHAESNRAWRSANRDYDRDRRWRVTLGAAKEQSASAPPTANAPAPVPGVPGDVVQDEMGRRSRDPCLGAQLGDPRRGGLDLDLGGHGARPPVIGANRRFDEASGVPVEASGSRHHERRSCVDQHPQKSAGAGAQAPGSGCGLRVAGRTRSAPSRSTRVCASISI
jgi:hypothetical protein